MKNEEIIRGFYKSPEWEEVKLEVMKSGKSVKIAEAMVKYLVRLENG